MPPECLAAGKRCFIDFFAVALAGSREPVAEVLEKYLGREEGVCSVIGIGRRTTPEGAAFANGVLGHVLDYDDVKSRIGHGTVVLAPPLLALGEQLRKSGLEILVAFIAGFEISSRIANAVEPAHTQRGWHSTSTCGVFGAAAACSKLLGLERNAFLGALGLAGSLSGGIRKNLATPAKPVHAGQAAQNGLKAAIFSSLGIPGALDIFSGKGSFGEAFSSPIDQSRLLLNLGKDFEIHHNGFKLYPCCASAHSAIDAILELRRRGLRPEMVAQIRVGTVPLVLDNLVYADPQNTAECRFSLHFCLSVALVDGRLDLDNFSPERMRDPRLRDLMRKIDLYRDPEMTPLGYRGTENASVQVVTHGGEVLKKRIDEAHGRPSNPLSGEELEGKFRRCARRAISDEQAEKLLSALTALEKWADVGTLLDW
ncbi:MAG: MmgE/PrpD family protein [Deltaproteobacteria bacterium]|nr:MmgE/PrpD family protein [Deltaproteobacteria bacterium]